MIARVVGRLSMQASSVARLECLLTTVHSTSGSINAI